MSTPLPLFDRMFEKGESSVTPAVVKRRAIRSQPVAPARATDPDTSQQAASANQEIRGAQRIRVFRYLESAGAQGATDYEIGVALSILRTSAGKRRKELCDLGHVEDSVMRRRTDSSSSATVWRIIKQGAR